MKGSYVLILKCKQNIKIKVGKLGKVKFEKGFYAYVGSAMNNLEKRIERHLRKKKKKKWHIDYLTSNKNFEVIKVEKFVSESKLECKISNFFQKRGLKFVKNFGSSDCKCLSHLYFSKSYKKIKSLLKDVKKVLF